MLKQWNHLYLARVCVEAQTPLSIQSGQAEMSYDTSLVRDANGLPTLPATSIRGVLRHLFQTQFNEEKTHTLFGYAQTHTKEPKDQTSRIQISWGVIHDKHNHPVEGLVYPSEDPDFLDPLAQSQPIKRERVRLNHKGCAEDQGKFDVSACPKGARFTFEIKYWSDSADDTHWEELMALLQKPNFRLGSSTRSGFGSLSIQQMESHHFDLKNPNDIAKWCALDRSIAVNSADAQASPPSEQSPDGIHIHLKLKADGFIRIGGGDIPMHETSDPADLRMQSESYIQWTNDQGRFSKRQPLIPASSIKGAIAHRTLYHCNRLKGQFADQLTDELFISAATREHHSELTDLLGYAKNEGDEGGVGKLLIDDIYLPENAPTTQLWHNRIDRFTGGVIDGALFTEEVLFEPELEFDLTLLDANSLSDLAQQALKATLDDLCHGRLPLGAAGSRGLGSFTGEYHWAEHTTSQVKGEL
ncbi:RAMP superfamily CRISPR-associated protein [Marinomonas spartinae]|uniref:RAMP superfamily CRISPR-associated protein n=1 Tax=Marinomonas spartinae TaxID=1792290 RepID=UPI0018F124AF|nr:RAMP superfamily CRISPR-associated protein [Marinomonas spartinae]MBJ7556671.1 hypothetical protein [Marinomonas spartinae]